MRGSAATRFNYFPRSMDGGKREAAGSVKIYRDCLSNQDILTGVRWMHEFQTCRAAKLCDAWIYISRPGTSDSTNEITPGDCDVVIRNHGTIEEFKAELRRWAGGRFPLASRLQNCAENRHPNANRQADHPFIH